jgi:hypothetical protein
VALVAAKQIEDHDGASGLPVVRHGPNHQTLVCDWHNTKILALSAGRVAQGGENVLVVEGFVY